MVPEASAQVQGRGQDVESTLDERSANSMRLLRISPIAALGAAAALAVGAPAAGAAGLTPFGGVGTTPIGGLQSPGAGVGTTACGAGVGADLQGRTGGNDISVCGSGLTFIAPAVGPVSSVIGPTIITAAYVGNTTVTSAGNVAVGIGP
jgi:hypothetical protein